MRERLVLGDWARILGLYLVILGHFFPGMVKSFIFLSMFLFSFLYQGINVICLYTNFDKDNRSLYL